MEHFQKLSCRYCASTDLQKNGKNQQSKQCYRCKYCKRSFILNYTYNAYKTGVREQIDEMLLNSSGTRDIGRVLNSSFAGTKSLRIKGIILGKAAFLFC